MFNDEMSLDFLIDWFFCLWGWSLDEHILPILKLSQSWLSIWKNNLWKSKIRIKNINIKRYDKKLLQKNREYMSFLRWFSANIFVKSNVDHEQSSPQFKNQIKSKCKTMSNEAIRLKKIALNSCEGKRTVAFSNFSGLLFHSFYCFFFLNEKKILFLFSIKL